MVFFTRRGLSLYPFSDKLKGRDANFSRSEVGVFGSTDLEDKGLLEISGPLYKTTSKGKEFLQDYQKMREVLRTEEA